MTDSQDENRPETRDPNRRRGSYFPLRDRSFTSTAVVAPIVATLVGGVALLGITGGFSWVSDKVNGDKIHVTASRSPRFVESPKGTPSAPVSATALPSQSPSESVSGTEVDPDTAMTEGLGIGQNSYQCPWDTWVVKTPPRELVEAPVKGLERDDDLVSYRNAGDPDRSVLYLTVQPEGSRPLLIKEIRIRVVERNPVPGPEDATVLGLMGQGCGGGPDVVQARADLDGGGPYARVVATGGNATFPWEITGGRTLSVDLTVTTRTCDCAWYPEIVWEKDGEVHTTRWDANGTPFRTIPSSGYQRTAWKLHYAGQDGFSKDGWDPIPFDDRLLP